MRKLTNHRRLTNLSREAISLHQHALEVADALRRIRLDTSLSMEAMRAAIDDILDMVRRFADPCELG